jgi:transposase InsO family protein
MREQALRARPRRRGLPQDRGQRSTIADNVLDRQFQADAPNQKWVADFTYIWTAEGWLYAAAVLDLYSRRIVGWSMHDSMTSQLVADALMMAVWRRSKPGALLHHSDRGSQGGFNRSSQHRVGQPILGSHSASLPESSNLTSCVACCSRSVPRLESLARTNETGRCV